MEAEQGCKTLQSKTEIQNVIDVIPENVGSQNSSSYVNGMSHGGSDDVTEIASSLTNANEKKHHTKEDENGRESMNMQDETPGVVGDVDSHGDMNLVTDSTSAKECDTAGDIVNTSKVTCQDLNPIRTQEKKLETSENCDILSSHDDSVGLCRTVDNGKHQSQEKVHLQSKSKEGSDSITVENESHGESQSHESNRSRQQQSGSPDGKGTKSASINNQSSSDHSGATNITATADVNSIESLSSKSNNTESTGKQPPDDDVIVIDDDDDEPVGPRPKPVRKKSSQAAICKCILCGDMVRLSTLGLHVNNLHSKLIVKGNASIECKVCEEFFTWSNFVDHAQVKHKWSIVKNSSTKAKAVHVRTDYENMNLACIWCKEKTNVACVATHFKTVHKVDSTVIERAMKLSSKDSDKGMGDPNKNSLPTGITGALFVTCAECNKDLKFSEVLNHFQFFHRKSKVTSSLGQASNKISSAQRMVTKPSVTQHQRPKPVVNKGEQLITLFKGQINLSKSPNYALVKLAHDGKDKILSIPFSHPIAIHRVHTIAVKGDLDDIPALIQSVTDLLASQKPPAEPLVPPATQGAVPPPKQPPQKQPSVILNKLKIPTAVKDSKEGSTTPSEGEKASSNNLETEGKSTSLNKNEEKDTNDASCKKEGNDTSSTDVVASDKLSSQDDNEKNEDKSDNKSPIKSPSKKGSPRGSLSRLLELQRESIGNSAEEEDADSSDRPLRRSSRRAKLAAKLKIKSVVEKEIEEWKKLPEQAEYIPTEEEKMESKLAENDDIYVVSSNATNHTTSQPTKSNFPRAIEQYIFRPGIGGKKVLVPFGTPESKSTPPQVTVSKQVTKGLPRVIPSISTHAPSAAKGLTVTTTAGKLPGSVGQLKTSTHVTKQQKSAVRNTVISAPKPIAPQQQASTTAMLPPSVTVQSPQLYQQPSAPSGQVVLNQVGSPQGGAQYIIQPQQQSVTFMQPTTVLQQGLGGVGNVQVQLQPQTVPVQSPNMMVVQNRLQLVTTPQGQQILLLPSNNNISQPVVVNQMSQNRMIFTSVGPQQSIPQVQPNILNNAPQAPSPQTLPSVTLSKPQNVKTKTSPLQVEKRVTLGNMGSPQQTLTNRVNSAPSTSTDFIRISELSTEKDGFVCQKADISVKTFREKVVKNIPVNSSSATTDKTKEQVIEAKKAAEEDANWLEDYARVVTISTARGSIMVSDLPDIPSIMFECSRCGTGMPTHMLLRTHLVDCFDTPPIEEPSYIVRLPFSLLQMFYVTGPEPGGIVSCKLCNKIIPRAGNKDLIPLQAHVREHQSQNTALKGGSVTFGVLSLNKISVLKCKLCGEVILRLWQDITPMGAHLQKHIKGNVEILCNQPPVFGLTSKPHAQHISKKAYTWVDYIVPPFTMENPPISEKQNNLDSHVATAGILHHESLLPRRKRRYQSEPEAPRLRGKTSQTYQSNLKPLIIETSTADTVTSYDIRPGKTNLLHSIKSMPSPNKLKRSTLTASIPVKTKNKTVMAQSSGSDRRKIYRQGPYRSARLQEKREKYLKEIEEAAEAGSGTDSPLNPSTPVKEQETVKNTILPVTCSKSQKFDKLLPATVTTAQQENAVTKTIHSATVMLKKFAETQCAKILSEESNRIQAKRLNNAAVKELPLSKNTEVEKFNQFSWDEAGTEYVEPVMPPRTPSPPKPETPPPPISEGDISDYLQILDGCDSAFKESEPKTNEKKKPAPEIGEVSLSDYFGDSANTSILCEPLIIEQGQAPMYFTRSASTGYRFRCSFSKCEAAVPNNTLVMLAHLSQHFRVRIAGDFSQNGSVVGHRRTCKSLPLTINQVAAHFTLSDKEEASLHGGEVQMAYVCQWRNCNRTRTFKKGLITHLYRHVSFHLISESQHACLKEKSKPLKLSSAQFVPHGSGTKLITESMNTSHGLNFDKNKCPKLLGLLNQKPDSDSQPFSCGNYGVGSPMGSLIEKLASQVMTPAGNPLSQQLTVEEKSSEAHSKVPQLGEVSRAAYRKGKFPHQLGLSSESGERSVNHLRLKMPTDVEKATSQDHLADPSTSKRNTALSVSDGSSVETTSVVKRKNQDHHDGNDEERESKAKRGKVNDGVKVGEEQHQSNKGEVTQDTQTISGEENSSINTEEKGVQGEDKLNKGKVPSAGTKTLSVSDGSSVETTSVVKRKNQDHHDGNDGECESKAKRSKVDDGVKVGEEQHQSNKGEVTQNPQTTSSEENSSINTDEKDVQGEDKLKKGEVPLAGTESDSELTLPPLLSPETPCEKEPPKLRKQSGDAQMPLLDFVGRDSESEKVSCSTPDLPKLEFIGDS